MLSAMQLVHAVVFGHDTHFVLSVLGTKLPEQAEQRSRLPVTQVTQF